MKTDINEDVETGLSKLQYATIRRAIRSNPYSIRTPSTSRLDRDRIQQIITASPLIAQTQTATLAANSVKSEDPIEKIQALERLFRHTSVPASEATKDVQRQSPTPVTPKPIHPLTKPTSPQRRLEFQSVPRATIYRKRHHVTPGMVGKSSITVRLD